MLFHSPAFIFLFLPITLLGYFALGRSPGKSAFVWLTFASLFFYGFWNPKYLILISGSIGCNYVGGYYLGLLRDQARETVARTVFVVLILANIGLLAYFKYLMFFVGQADHLFGLHWNVGLIILPIGISFYTFTQIAYLADVFNGKVRERTFLSYVLFVTYFPHLVAGPVIHHAEMMPQFADRQKQKFDATNFARGVTFFAFGLFKKIVFADGCAPIANTVFNGVPSGLTAAHAWLGATAYSLQIYYDFSGYSDMAIGLSLLFNIRLPINFTSPYKAKNIIDFWRCWHITLSRFLRDYLYFPLGGNRKGSIHRHLNLMVTMVLGGLWHGANWTFVIWGGLHGAFLVVNHLWRSLLEDMPILQPSNLAVRTAYWILTLIAVVVGWVFFRASSFSDATTILAAMSGTNGVLAPAPTITVDSMEFIAALVAWALFAPNTNQVLDYDFGAQYSSQTRRSRLLWKPSVGFGIFVGLLFFICVVVGATSREKLEFLYFQF